MRLRNRTKKIITRAIAGVIAVLLTPAVALAVRKSQNIVSHNDNIIASVSTKDEPLTVVPQTVSIYAPDGINAVTRNTSPTLNTFSFTKETPSPSENSLPETLPQTPGTTPQTPSASTNTPEKIKTAGQIITNNKSTVKDDLSRFLKSESGEFISVYREHFGFSLGASYINLLNKNQNFAGQVRNKTDYPVDWVEEWANRDLGFSLNKTAQPEVLIYHTHATEGYMPSKDGMYSVDYNFRTLDPDNGVFSVGEEIAKQLTNAGISVIHDGYLHDDPFYNGAYERSLVTVKDYLEKYPSIKIILDIHRDGIADEEGNPVAPVTIIDGKSAAQIMIISAADDPSGSWAVPNFRKNLAFASAIEKSVETNYPGLARPVLFDYFQYNQQVSTGALLIEVGANGNTIDEAKYTGELLGKAIADVFE